MKARREVGALLACALVMFGACRAATEHEAKPRRALACRAEDDCPAFDQCQRDGLHCDIERDADGTLRVYGRKVAQ